MKERKISQTYRISENSFFERKMYVFLFSFNLMSEKFLVVIKIKRNIIITKE